MSIASTTQVPPGFGAPDAAAASGPGANGALTGAAQQLGRDEFLKLLMTQLQNQDPLNPMESYEFAAQLAQFSSVEQLINIGDAIQAGDETSGLMAQSINSSVATGLIGREVEAESNTVSLSGEGGVPFGFDLPADAEAVKVTITSEKDLPVRTLELGGFGAGEHQVAWDGKDDRGNLLDGTFTLTIEAVNKQGDAVVAQPIVKGVVDRVTFGPEGIQAWIGGAGIPMALIRSIREAE